jgi:hypothetical protein
MIQYFSVTTKTASATLSAAKPSSFEKRITFAWQAPARHEAD